MKTPPTPTEMFDLVHASLTRERPYPFENPNKPGGFFANLHPGEPDKVKATVNKIQAAMEGLPVQDQMRAWLMMDQKDLGDSPEAHGLVISAASRLLEWLAARTPAPDRASIDTQLCHIADRITMVPPIQKDPDAIALIARALRAGGRHGARLMGAAIRHHLAVKRRDLAAERVADAEATIDRERLHFEARQELERIAANPVLQRLGEAGYHKLMEAARALKLGVEAFDGTAHGALAQFPADLTADPHIFVVQHDWARAFEHAADFEGGDFHVPYPTAVFEFRVSGHRLIAVFAPGRLVDTEDPETCALFAELSSHWAVIAEWRHGPGGWVEDIVLSPPGNALMAFCLKQIRAVSIALDAEIAETEVVRAPHKLNRKRERAGKVPVLDHHIFSLAARKRYAPRLPEPGDLEREVTRRRLHFVRGHIRHYANHKVRIKWHMRGDPELGFIEKEYRL